VKKDKDGKLKIAQAKKVIAPYLKVVRLLLGTDGLRKLTNLINDPIEPIFAKNAEYTALKTSVLTSSSLLDQLEILAGENNPIDRKALYEELSFQRQPLLESRNFYIYERIYFFFEIQFHAL
jgi:hypothetical protein